MNPTWQTPLITIPWSPGLDMRRVVRASDMSIARWKLIAGLVATVLTSGGIAAALAQMLGG